MMESWRSTQRVAHRARSFVFFGSGSSLSLEIAFCNILLRFADADKKTDTEPTIPNIFLMAGILHALEIAKFNTWLKQ